MAAVVAGLLLAGACARQTTRLDGSGSPSEKAKAVFPQGPLFTLYQDTDVYVAELDMQAMALRQVASLSFNPVWSPSGDRYAVVRAVPITSVQQLVVYERKSPDSPIPIAQLTAETAAQYPVVAAFSPSGDQVVYTSVNAGLAGLFVSDVRKRSTVLLAQDNERRIRRVAWTGDWIVVSLTEGRVLLIQTRKLDLTAAPGDAEIQQRSYSFRNLTEPRIHAGNLYGLEPMKEGSRADYRLVMYRLDGERTPREPEQSILAEKVGPVFDIAPDGTLALLIASAQTRAPLELAVGPRPNLLLHTGIRPYQVQFAPDGKRIFAVTVADARPRYLMYSIPTRTAVEFGSLMTIEDAARLSAIVRQPLMSIR